MPRLKLKLKDVLTKNPSFIVALDALGSDPCVGVRDRYAISRSRRDIVMAIEDYEIQRVKLVKEVGKPELELVRQRITKLTGARMEPQSPAEAEAHLAEVMALKQREELLAKGIKSYLVDETDPDAIDKFNKAIEELQSIEVGVYLDHRIALSDGCKLTSRDMYVLDPLIDLAPQVPAKD